jgi:hypothetical protein
MHASPIHAILKPHSEKLHMVINQSAGPYALNLMFRRQDICGFPLDNMTHLGEGLIRKHPEKPGQHLVVFKSDVAKA